MKPIVLALSCLLLNLVMSQEYYDILGISKNANEEQIKKAFKKQAIKHHPDKNKDDPEGSKAIFQKIAHAYEVLSDPDKRQIYDQHGEEGVKKHAAGQNPNMNQDDMFQQFFHGGFRGGPGSQQGRQQHFQFNFGGRQQQQQQPKEDLFENSDVIKLNLEQIFQFYRRKEIWTILFYKTNDQESKNLKDQYKLLAEKMYGIVKVGAVECEDEEELCEEFSVYSVPTLFVFQESYGDDGEKYTGKMEWKSIATYATQKMQSFVSIVTEDNFESFIERDPLKYKVLLFTERKKTAPIFKALSKQYKDKLIFGEVRSSETKLVEKFSITKFPTMLIITDPHEFTSEIYEGELKIDRITKYLNNYSYKTVTYEKKMEIQQLTYQKMKTQGLCAKKSSNICLILFTDDQNTQLNMVEPLLDYYKKDPISFVYVQKSQEPELFEQLGGFEVVAYKAKRAKFVGIKESSIKSFIDEVLGGGGEYLKVEGELMLNNAKKEDL